jgi:hypothetical protein
VASIIVDCFLVSRHYLLNHVIFYSLFSVDTIVTILLNACLKYSSWLTAHYGGFSIIEFCFMILCFRIGTDARIVISRYASS